MILASDNEVCVVADACVLLPMPLCDTMLRSAEEPSFFRIVWSEEVLNEVRRGLVGENFGYNLTALSADDFLVHQYHLNPEVMLEKLDRQAAGIRKRRFEILQYLQKSAPTFCQICSKREGSHS
jgi:hypothetical protein